MKRKVSSSTVQQYSTNKSKRNMTRSWKWYIINGMGCSKICALENPQFFDKGNNQVNAQYPCFIHLPEMDYQPRLR